MFRKPILWVSNFEVVHAPSPLFHHSKSPIWALPQSPVASPPAGGCCFTVEITSIRIYPEKKLPAASASSCLWCLLSCCFRHHTAQFFLFLEIQNSPQTAVLLISVASALKEWVFSHSLDIGSVCLRRAWMEACVLPAPQVLSEYS